MAEPSTTNTEIRALKSKEEASNNNNNDYNNENDEEIAGLPTTQMSNSGGNGHPRIFSENNFNTTHTQRGGLEAEMANLKLGVHTDSAGNTPTPNNDNINTNLNTEISPSQTMMNIDRGQNAVNVAINSRPKRMCTFMPQKCHCSDRLTMQKTKFILYVFPFFLVIACFYVLISQQGVSSYTTALIFTLLLSSYIGGWIAILILLSLFQIFLMIRDSIFWCIVKKLCISAFFSFFSQ